MNYKDMAEAGMKLGPGGYKCRCCRLPMTKAQIHRKQRRFEKNKMRKENYV